MYVCVCNAITDKMIRQAAAEGVHSLAELTRRTGCASACGSCSDLAQQILAEHGSRERTSRQPFSLPMVAIAA